MKYNIVVGLIEKSWRFFVLFFGGMWFDNVQYK